MNKDISVLTDYLCRYLSYSMPKDKAGVLAHTLAHRYGNIVVISSSTVDELMELDGMTRSSALSLKLLGYVYARSVIDNFKPGSKHSDSEMTEYIHALFIGKSVETVYCILADEDERFISCEYMGEGTVNASEIYPRRILEYACKRNAKSVIIAHNHPRGTSEASNEDLSATQFIKHILKSAGIELTAHYLVSDIDCVKMEMDD